MKIGVIGLGKLHKKRICQLIVNAATWQSLY